MIIGYIRVSMEEQDVRNQRHEILEHANRYNLHIDRFVEVEMSTRKSLKDRRIVELDEKLQNSDTLIVSELSRLGRSVVEVISLINRLMARGVRVIALKQNLDVRGNHDITSKVLVTVFALLAELERDLVSERTRRALAAKRSQGVVLGRPVGSIGKSKLDGKISEIVDLLQDKASYSFIARRFRVSRPTVKNFVRTRNLLKASTS